MTRFIRSFAACFSQLTLLALAFSGFADLVIQTEPLPDFHRAQFRSQLVIAADGTTLWGFLSADDKWRLSATEGDVDPGYLKLLIAYEDQRFESHRGVDFLALARACLQAVRHGRAISGGSTLTMQVVRMLEPQPRSLLAKLDQIFKAIKLERRFTKTEILDLYLTMAPFGGNVEGVRAASLMFFGKTPNRLTLSESALLVALPQSPEQRRLDRYPGQARAGRDRVLRTLASRGVIDNKALQTSLTARLPAAQRPFAEVAPHLAMALRREGKNVSREVIGTLIDAEIQSQLNRVASQAIKSWSEGVSIAIIVIRNQDASVAGYLGGVDFSIERKGYVDLVQATRSPGSALKPFIYAMAFEKLIVHPDTIITDQPIEIAGYSPENADGQYSGDISIRQALVKSRNIPAVILLDRLGAGNFLARFRAAGKPLLMPDSLERPGLAIALGGVGVSLEQLAWFYTVFPNDGELRSLRFTPNDPTKSLGQFVSRPAARAVADILGDVPAPVGYSRQLSLGSGRRIGFKTGTSYGFRDAWAVGFDRLHTVGVWVGRPDGAAHLGSYGATVAAPLLMQVFDQLPVPRDDVGGAAAELGALTSYRDLPPRLVHFNEYAHDDPHSLQITFPENGATIHLERSPDGTAQLPLNLAGGTPPYQWTIAGKQLEPTSLVLSQCAISGRGQFELSVADADGKTARSSFWLELARGVK